MCGLHSLTFCFFASIFKIKLNGDSQFFLFYFLRNVFLCVTKNSDEMNEETKKKQRKEEVSKSIGFFGGTNTNKAGEIRQLTKLT